MINILRMINKEKNLIDQELLEEDERLEFYREIFSRNSCTTLNEAIKANHSDLAVAIILNNEPEISVEEAKRVVYSNRDIFENLNIEAIGELVKLIDGLANNEDLYSSVRKHLRKEKGIKISSIFSQEGQIALMIQHLADTMDTTPEAFLDFIDVFLEHSHGFVLSLSTVATLREVKEDREMHYQMIQDLCEEENARVKTKVQDKWVSEMVRDVYDVKTLLHPIVEAKKEYHNLDQDQKNRRRYLSKTKVIYEQLETNLYKAISEGEVRNIEALLKKVPSDEIRMAILKLVYNHNHEIYKKLSKEYQELAANDASHYQVLLAKYGISPEHYEVGTVMENSIDDLTNMLSILSKLKITSPEEILVIIQNSDLETLTNLYGLAERGIITSNLLSNYQNLFNPSSKEYEDFMRNLSLITKKKLNPHYFTTSEEVLITPHQRIETSIKTLEEYSLVSNIKTGMNLSFLKEEDLAPAIDTLLELGYEKNLEESLELLNYRDKFDRLRVLKVLNIPVSTTEELIEVLTTPKFYIPDTEIPNYIYNAAQYHLPSNVVEVTEPKKKTTDVQRLSSFSETDRTYSFNGVLISKNKVHRTLSHVLATGKPTDRLKYGVLKDSILTDEEVLKVVAALTPQKTTNAAKTKK